MYVPKTKLKRRSPKTLGCGCQRAHPHIPLLATTLHPANYPPPNTHAPFPHPTPVNMNPLGIFSMEGLGFGNCEKYKDT